MTHDVIVIGGSYAGMAAALQLLRARRSVLVLDEGLRRNRAASHAHGFLTQDGTPPAEIAASARAQLQAYATLIWIDTRAVEARGAKDAFEVTDATGATHHGRRLLFALGVSDTLPAIPGLADRWGQSVFHCPYCHGYELNRGPIGVIAASEMSVHQAQLLPEWGPTTFLTNGIVTPDAATAADLAARGVTVDPRPIAAISGEAEVTFTDGATRAFAGLFTASKNAPASPIAETLGCALTETPFGTQIARDGMKETTIPGAFACGDVASTPHSVALAVGDGSMAGAMIHRSLVF